ncbi:unnamed protein product [Ascophyllum nodosum]
MKLGVFANILLYASPTCSFLVPLGFDDGLSRCHTAGGSLVGVRNRRSEMCATYTAPGEWDATFFSPAKINLFLRVLRKRSDGFHDLASLFQTVAFGDNLFFKILPRSADGDEFGCNMDGVPLDKTNLVLKALELFRMKTATNIYFKVYLSKRVPPEAGLGGGSSNAATALFAANELAGRPASLRDLQAWSATLGSDITFFLSTGTCYCTGRGEILHPQNPLPPTRIWLVKPREGLSTRTVFGHIDYDHLSPIEPSQLLHQFTQHGLDADFVNDLESPAFKAMPSLLQMKQELEDLGFKHVVMSGSGSTMFCIGNPTGDGHWQEHFSKKWGATIVKTRYINRASDPHTWYAETSGALPVGPTYFP